MKVEGLNMKIKAKDGRYYDLIHVPHGHIPTPLMNLWSHLPLPIKDFRTGSFYRCPECGMGSFFKVNSWCDQCDYEFTYETSYGKYIKRRYHRRRRRKYFKELLKQVEYWFLPILVVLGKAWYVRSERLHHTDLEHQSCPCDNPRLKCSHCKYIQRCGGCGILYDEN